MLRSYLQGRNFSFVVGVLHSPLVEKLSCSCDCKELSPKKCSIVLQSLFQTTTADYVGLSIP
jgi:hypothetical protein